MGLSATTPSLNQLDLGRYCEVLNTPVFLGADNAWSRDPPERIVKLGVGYRRSCTRYCFRHRTTSTSLYGTSGRARSTREAWVCALLQVGDQIQDLIARTEPVGDLDGMKFSGRFCQPLLKQCRDGS